MLYRHSAARWVGSCCHKWSLEIVHEYVIVCVRWHFYLSKCVCRPCMPCLLRILQVLRKGSGTLCEQLLMVQAFQKSIVCPNKHTSAAETFFKVSQMVLL